MWRTSAVEQGPSQLEVFAADGVAVVATGINLSAYSLADGHRVWQRTDLSAPVAVAGTRLIAVTNQSRAVAVAPSSGKTLWAASRAQAGTTAVLAADRNVVALAIFPADLEGGGTSEVYALDPATGAVRWKSKAGSGVGGGIAVTPSLVLLSYAAGEPHFGDVEAFDRKTGAALPIVGSESLADDAPAYGAMWGEASGIQPDIDASSPLWQFDRYDAHSMRQLAAYVYSPEPDVNRGKFSLDVPRRLTQRYVFLEVGDDTLEPYYRRQQARLYRYDRDRPPSAQVPLRYDVRGELDGVVAHDDPLLLAGSRATLLVPFGKDTYVAHRYDFSQQLPHPMYLSAGATWVGATLRVAATSADASLVFAFNRETGTVLQMTRTGDAYALPSDVCRQPSEAAFLPSGEGVVLCKDAVLRVRAGARGTPVSPAPAFTSYSIAGVAPDAKVAALTVAQGGDLWAAVGLPNVIVHVRPDGPALTTVALPSGDPPTALGFASGGVWYARAGRIGRIKEDGSVQEFALKARLGPRDFAWAGINWPTDPAVWITLCEGNALGGVGLDGALALVPLPTPASCPTRMTYDGGWFWFVENNGARIGRAMGRGSPDGPRVEEIAIGGGPASGITVGPDAYVWYTHGSTIGRIDFHKDRREFALPQGLQATGAIVAGADGALWFWVSSSSGLQLARMTTSGAVTVVPVGRAGLNAGVLARGLDGALYFPAGNEIVRFDPELAPGSP